MKWMPLVARRLPILALLLLAHACSQVSVPQDADVIVAGAGIAGLAAALEAAENGARVLVIDTNSVGGGHAVKAGGFALVDTALQREKGIEDSADLAYRDLVRWGENPDPYWSRYYAEHSAANVYDWLTGLGVEFRMVLPTPDATVPRFHFTRGTAINAVIPMLRKALLHPQIRFVWNTRVTALARARGAIIGVYTVNERNGLKQEWRAPSTVLATGGFQSNLNMVRMNWPEDKALPQQIFAGAGRYATGDGYRLAEWAGAEMRDMDRQVTFYSGVPDPRSPAGGKALYIENPASIWLNANGRRFMNEAADDKTVAATAGLLDPTTFWMIFDSRGSKRLNVRDALVANRAAIRSEILSNEAITAQAEDIATLARMTGLPAHGLRTSLEAWNRMVDIGTDFQFGRFSPDDNSAEARKIKEPPFYALQVYPLTRKNLGGPAIDINARVVDSSDMPIAGLYAAGELTGVAGINGSHGGAGTFLGPSVLTGRIAGRQAALGAQADGAARMYRQPDSEAAASERIAPAFGLPGYWHYDHVHRLVAEQEYTCDRCHTSSATMQTAVATSDMLTRLNTCTACH